MYKTNTDTAFTIWGQFAKLSCSLDPITFYGLVRRYHNLDKMEYIPFQFSQGFEMETNSEKAAIQVSMDRNNKLFIAVIEKEPSSKGKEIRSWMELNEIHNCTLITQTEFLDIVDMVSASNWRYYKDFLGYEIR